MENMDRLRVLELYSGIGGMHYALKESSVPAEVVAAVDVNTTANEIYKHNFPTTPLLPKTIEGMTLQDFDKLNFDMILMSPPCQPFTSRMVFFLLWNTTGEILITLIVVLFHGITVNGDWSFQAWKGIINAS